MPDPTWLGEAFAVLFISVGVYCAVRLAGARRFGWGHAHADVNVGHVLMAIAMIGMLVPQWNFVPVRLGEVIFALVALWFLMMAARVVVREGRAVWTADGGLHVRHYAIHMVMAFAMLYMYWLGMPIVGASSHSMWGRTGMAMSGAPTSGGDPGLTLLLIVALLSSAVWQLDAIERVVGSHPPVAVAAGATGELAPAAVAVRVTPRFAPRLEVACHVATCVGMAYALVLMV